MNLVRGLALHEFSVALVDREPAWCLGVWEVIGSKPVRDSDFFLCPTLVTCLLFHFHISNFRYDGNSTLLNLLQETRLMFNEKNRLLRYKAF